MNGPSGPRAWARSALQTARTMGRYGAEGNAAGVANGLRALRALSAEVARAARGAHGSRRCPICGWSGARFGPAYYYDSYREDARCWRCGSSERCRLFKLYLEQCLAGFFEAAPRRVLDVGPVPYSRAFFPGSVGYASLDLCGRVTGVRGDLTRAPFPDGGFDFWLCSHVLDVIPDDGAALAELFRVLAPGGLGLLDNRMTGEPRTRRFDGPLRGECGRLRRYGWDLLERVREVGFEVEVVDPKAHFDPAQQRRHGLRRAPFLLCRRPGPTTGTIG